MASKRFLAVGAIIVPAALISALVYLACGETMVHVPGIVHLVAVTAAGALAGAAARPSAAAASQMTVLLMVLSFIRNNWASR